MKLHRSRSRHKVSEMSVSFCVNNIGKETYVRDFFSVPLGPSSHIIVEDSVRAVIGRASKLDLQHSFGDLEWLRQKHARISP